MSLINYRAGSWIAMVRSNTLVVLPAGTEQSTIDNVWDSLLDSPDIERILRSVTSGFGSDPTALPGFAIALLAEPLHVIIRGNIRLVSHGPTPLEIDGARITTWSEQVIFGQDAFELTMDDGGGAARETVLPLLGGIVLASRLDVRLEADKPVGLELKTPERVEVRPEQKAPVHAEVRASPQEVDAHKEETADQEEAAHHQEDGNASDSAATLRPEDPPVGAGFPTGLIDSVPWTKHRAEAASEGVEETGAAVAADHTDATGNTGATDDAGDHDGHTVMSSDLPGNDEDHDGQTVMSTALPAAPSAGSGQETATVSADKPGTGPVIVGRVCPQDHANPPTNSRCSICGSPISAEPGQVRRPSLGRMRISTGEVVELDRSVIIGRQPSASRVRGDVMPRLVQVKSGDGDISRSHFEVQLEGWHVMLRDLHSTNGTFLIRPGQSPRRLVPGEQTMLLDGDSAEIGDNVTVLFEDLQ